VVAAIRLRVASEADGELRLRGLPIRKGEQAQVIVLTDEDGDSSDEITLSILREDPAWAWLHDPAEDVYTAQDVRAEPDC
jgi:hypothetical protein